MNQSNRERFNISKLAIKYARLTICFWLAIAVVGLFALSSLKYALFPDLSFPVVVINAQSPIETAIDTETQLTQPLEKPLNPIEGVRDISSNTYAGRSIINVFFDVGTNLETATEAVKTTLAKLSLPAKATSEVIPIDLNESAAISYVLISQDQSLEELTTLANEQIIPQIKALPGVLKVNLLGDANSSSQNQQFPTLVRFNQQDALAFQVIKKGTANTLEVVNQVEKAVQTLQTTLPNVQLVLAETQANYIREATRSTIDDLILAVILAVLVLFPFLRSFRATLIPALAIPLSLLGTCIVMAIAGFNLETITLLALALVIGIVVDDAIVDVENIARHIAQGENPREAAIKGTNEIGLAVVAATVTIVVVFLPVAFMGGSVGKFFKPFGLTVSAAVLISLLVARTLSPVLAMYWLKPKRESQPETTNFSLSQAYRHLLRWALNHKKMVIGIAILSFVAGIALIPLIPQGFVPKLDRGEFNIIYTTALPKVTLESNRSVQPTTQEGAFDWISEIAKSPERILLRRTIKIGKELETKVLESPEVDSVFMIAGLQGQPNKGKLYVTLKNDRQFHTADIQEQIRSQLPELKGVTVSVEDIPFVQTEAEKPLQMAIKSNDLTLVPENAQKLKINVQQLPGLEDVELSNDGSNTVIERLNGQYTIYLSANLAQEKGLEDAATEVEKLAQSIFPPTVTLERWGSSAQSNDVLSSFGRTLAIAVILMLLVLILLYKRVLEPIVIGLSLPLSIVGAMLGLLLTQSAFGVISLIGLIFLLGLLNKNAILLLDYINQLRQAGWQREEAILETGAVRLRPIMMTTASTILGMLPIALGLGTGSELRQPMAVAIIGGLITSSLLSLIVVPVLYTILDDLWVKMFRRKKSN